MKPRDLKLKLWAHSAACYLRTTQIKAKAQIKTQALKLIPEFSHEGLGSHIKLCVLNQAPGSQMKPWARKISPAISNEAMGSQIKALGAQYRMLSTHRSN